MSSDLLEAFGTHGGNATDIQSSISVAADVSNSSSSGAMPVTTHRTHPVSQGHDLSAPTISRTEPIFKPGIGHGNDILFDADDDVKPDNEDDFGDFESADDGRQRAVSTGATTINDSIARSGNHEEGQLIDLLGLENTGASARPSGDIRSNRNTGSSDFFSLTAAEHALPLEHKHQPTTARIVAVEDDEGWGDFEDAENVSDLRPPNALKAPVQPTVQNVTSLKIAKVRTKSTTPQQVLPASEAADFGEWDEFEDDTSTVIPKATQKSSNVPASSVESAAKASAIPKESKRPTNMPPPAILLSLLPLSTAELVSQILSASTHVYTSSQLLAYHRVACRLISTPARTLRWRRDTILAQSMRISVAGKMTTSGGVGAMKLSSVNKGEIAREEREAAEAVEVWNKNLHQFSKTFAGSGMKLPPGVRLRLSMDIGIKPLKGGGAIQSTIICPLCGLKRNERTIGADDIGMEDIFGLYWLEDWGHVDCAEWWYRWKDDLSQR
jgi:hypothetical protein